MDLSPLFRLVHNDHAWDCGRFLELRELYLKGKLKGPHFAEYVKYAETLSKNFRKYMDPKDVKFLENLKPTDMDSSHLHHILQKMAGSKDLADEILQVQKTLWYKYGIDPFVSADILVWAPNVAGQHGRMPMRRVIDELKDLFTKTDSKADVIELLRELGRKAAGK